MNRNNLLMINLLSISSFAAPDFSVVDSYKETNELLKERKTRSEKVDSCVSNLTPIKSFSDAIENAIDYSLGSRKVKDSYYRSPYKLVPESNKASVGLFSNRFCELSEPEIKHMFSEEKDYPTDQTLAQMKNFVNKYNEEFDKTSVSRSKISKIASDITTEQNKISKIESDIKEIESRKQKPLNRGQQAQARLNNQISQLQANKQAALSKIQSLRAESSSTESKIYSQRGNVKRLYRVFFGCMAYTESLSDPDTQKSVDVYEKFVAGKFAAQGADKPSGVKFYEDRPAEFINTYLAKRKEIEPSILKELLEQGMSEEAAATEAANKAIAEARAYAMEKIPKTWLGIGLYQYTTATESSVFPCMQQWNERFSSKPGCSVRERNEAEHVSVLGSSLQTFNAFCGVHRISTQFDTMVNSTELKRTALANKNVNGSLKPANDRCVSLFASPRKYFVHYSALGNLIPGINNGHGNLGILMNCVDTGIKKLGL